MLGYWNAGAPSSYTQGILANNEWLEGWLDEGVSEFQGSLWIDSTQPGRDTYAEAEPFVTGLDLVANFMDVVEAAVRTRQDHA